MQEFEDDSDEAEMKRIMKMDEEEDEEDELEGDDEVGEDENMEDDSNL